MSDGTVLYNKVWGKAWKTQTAGHIPCNFTHIPWTLALHHQLRQCYEIWSSKHGHPSIEKSLEVGPVIKLKLFYFPLCAGTGPFNAFVLFW